MKINVHYNEIIDIPLWILDELKGNELLAQILLQRGVDSPKKVREFLNPDLYTPTDPFEFPNMEKAIEMIIAAVDKKKIICIYGDYDVDGTTSTTILVKVIRSIGGNVSYHVPNRFTEGYGMNEGVIRELSKEVNLIITCDCGISNHTEISLAKELGMAVIVTDHHHLPDELPPADAIVTPKLLPENHRAHNIPGAGMAYFLARGILTSLNREKEVKDYLDLTALAVVADVVPLHGENRYLLQKGLPVLASTTRPGLVELFSVCGFKQQEISEEEIGFQIAPRINAAGRISSAKLAVELLLADEKDEAKSLAKQLDQINSRRKELGEGMYEEAKSILGVDFEAAPIILYRPRWHEGILGITASKLCEDYNVPVLLMGLKEDGKTITGSARSVANIHIYDALKKCEGFLNKFGGHAGAAGFSLTREKRVAFEKSMLQVLAEEIKEIGNVREITVDGKLSLSQVSQKMYFDLRKLAPFGEANRVPIFYCQDSEVVYHRATSNEKHLRLILRHENKQHSAIWWWGGGKEIGQKVDLTYSIGINRWQGREEVQLIVDQIITHDHKLKEKLLKPEEKLDFEIQDFRNWREIGRELPDFSNAVYYYEGTDEIRLTPTINRYQFSNADHLILVSIPPGLRVLKELIYSVKPKTLVLAYSNREMESDAFMKRLIGVLKYVIERKDGKAGIYQISVLTGEMEHTVSLGLNYLVDKGMIELENTKPEELIIKKGDGKSKKGIRLKEERLKALLTESRAFRKYLLKTEFMNLKKLIIKD
ncbi:MAG: single-stranded-DNA-specific exonuclease RecJ [Halanaerobiales bacterium]|nr:single-stranded-DNA-specific exonuclease RecJ [Halanaerobiales bacterium]